MSAPDANAAVAAAAGVAVFAPNEEEAFDSTVVDDDIKRGYDAYVLTLEGGRPSALEAIKSLLVYVFDNCDDRETLAATVDSWVDNSKRQYRIYAGKQEEILAFRDKHSKLETGQTRVDTNLRKNLMPTHRKWDSPTEKRAFKRMWEDNTASQKAAGGYAPNTLKMIVVHAKQVLKHMGGIYANRYFNADFTCREHYTDCRNASKSKTLDTLEGEQPLSWDLTPLFALMALTMQETDEERDARDPREHYKQVAFACSVACGRRGKELFLKTFSRHDDTTVICDLVKGGHTDFHVKLHCSADDFLRALAYLRRVKPVSDEKEQYTVSDKINKWQQERFPDFAAAVRTHSKTEYTLHWNRKVYVARHMLIRKQHTTMGRVRVAEAVLGHFTTDSALHYCVIHDISDLPAAADADMDADADI